MEDENWKSRGDRSILMKSSNDSGSPGKDKSKPRGGRNYRPSFFQQYRNGTLFKDPNSYMLAGLFLFNLILLVHNLNHPEDAAISPAGGVNTESRHMKEIPYKEDEGEQGFPSKEDYFPKKEAPHYEHHLLEYTDDDEYEVEKDGGARVLKDSLFQEPDEGDCDRFMGNAMEEPFHICAPWGEDDRKDSNGNPVKDERAEGEIKCGWHKTLKSSFCEATNLMVDPSRIRVAPGGEPIHSVKNRDEAEEIPSYQSGAFQISQCNLEDVNQFDGKIKYQTLPYHLRDMMKSVREQEAAERSWYGEIFGANNAICSSYEERPTLVITRYEYANLYHTYTEWYSAYQAAMFALKGKKEDVDNVNIVFFDGHAEGALDFGWKLLFKNATVSFISEYQQSYRDDGSPIPICFRHAIFVPAGYISSPSIQAVQEPTVQTQATTFMPYCGESKWQRRFRETMVRNSQDHLARWKGFLYDHYDPKTGHGSAHPCHSHHFPWVHPHHAGESTAVARHRNLNQKNTIKSVRVLLLSRKNYYAHPRMDGAVSRQIENEEELMSFLQNFVPSDPLKILNFEFPSIDVRRVVLEEHDITEQIMMFQQANIVVGMHGAGLSHIILARPGTMLMELVPPRFENQHHFQYLANMAGCIYHAHRLNVERPVNHNDPYPVPIQQFELAFMDGVATFLDHHGAL